VVDASPSAPAAPHAGLNRVVAAELVSNFGSMLSRLTIPWIATLVLGATPWQMGLLLMADVAAGAAGALLLGVAIDRWPPRRTMLLADGLRALLLLGLALMAWQGRLTMAVLVPAAAASGLATMAFELARSAWIARAIAADHLTSANARLSAGSSLAETAAFAIGGWLYQGLGAVIALLIDAASYLLSALCLRGVRVLPAAAAPRDAADAAGSSRIATAWQALRTDVAGGLDAIRADRRLRLLAWVELLVSLAMAFGGTSYMIFVSRDLGFAPGVLGLIFAVGGLGALAGAGLAVRLDRGPVQGRDGERASGPEPGSALRSDPESALKLDREAPLRPDPASALTPIAIGLTLLTLGQLCVPLAPSAGWLGAALLVMHQLIGDAGRAVQEVHDRGLRQRSVPAALLARVDGGLRTIGQGATLLGALAGGVTATAFGARTALWFAALFTAAAALAAWRAVVAESVSGRAFRS
jgi:predicted MFS family arabinose efflux permease